MRAAECNRLGMVIDCAHATFETTAGVLEAARQPVMVAHSDLDHPGRRHPRLLSPTHARAVADAGALRRPLADRGLSDTETDQILDTNAWT